MGVIPINFGVEAEVFLRQKRNMSRYVNDLIVKWGINDVTALPDATIKQIVFALINRLGDSDDNEKIILRNDLLNFLEGSK